MRRDPLRETITDTLWLLLFGLICWLILSALATR